MFIKQSTAVTVKVGPFVDSVDGNTQETGLTISQADIRLSKNGGAFAQTNNATGATHDAAGWYGVPLDTTDTNTLGKLELSIHEAGALCVWRTFMVMPANVWDSLFGADALQVHAVEITNGLITAAAIATGAIDADAIAADAVTEIQAGLATPTNITAGTITTATNVTTVNGLAAGVITAAAVATGAIDADAISADAVTEIQSGLATSASIAALNNLSSAQVTAAVPTTAQITTAVLAGAVDGATTLAESQALQNSALAGKLSGAGTGTETARDLADTKDRLVYTVDASGNRTAVTRTLT